MNKTDLKRIENSLTLGKKLSIRSPSFLSRSCMNYFFAGLFLSGKA